MSEYMVFALLGFGLGRRPGAARHRILLGFRGSGDVNFSQGAAAMFPAGDALAAGLVDQVVAAGDLLPAARHRARELVAHSAPVSVAPTRRLPWQGLTVQHPREANQIETRLIRALAEPGHPRRNRGIP